MTRLLYHLIIPENLDSAGTTELIPSVLIIISAFSLFLIPSGLVFWLFPQIFTSSARSAVLKEEAETNRQIYNGAANEVPYTLIRIRLHGLGEVVLKILTLTVHGTELSLRRGMGYLFFPQRYSQDYQERTFRKRQPFAKLERKKTKQRVILVFISIILLLTVLTLYAIISGEFGEK